MNQPLQRLLDKLRNGENDMGPILTILLPILLQMLPKLLESLVKKNDMAVKSGFEGPLTAWSNALAAGKGDQEAFESFCAAYCRCCEHDRKNPQP